jgi:superfamily II DNA or RNA helicase
VGVDTVLARADSLKDVLRAADRWIIDEAHHVLRDNKWGKAVELMPRAWGLGVTASPCRADGKGLGSHADGVMDDMVLGPTTRQLIDMGALCEYQIVCPDVDFQRPERVGSDGDFTRAAMAEATEKSHIVGDIVEQYLTWSAGKQAIVFVTDVQAAMRVAEKFRDFGVNAQAVSGKTDTIVRDLLVSQFRKGELTVLVNVDLFGEGFDVPACETVIMGRPTRSLSMFLQQFGRALRTSPGKRFGLVIDMVRNVWGPEGHGLPDKHHMWSLDRRQKRATKVRDPEEIDLIACRNCSKPYERAKPVCPHCGHEPVKVLGERTLEQVDGDLTLLTPEMLARLRAATQLETPDSVAARAALAGGHMAGVGAMNRQIERHGAQQELAAQLALWAGIQRARGRSDAEIYRRFYLTSGTDMMSALSGKRAELEQMREIVETWMR